MPVAACRIGFRAASVASSKVVGSVIRRSVPSRSWISGERSLARIMCASAAARRSMQVIAVRGSLIPGDRARSAISTRASIENSTSWVGVRFGPRTTSRAAASTTLSLTRACGQTCNRGRPAITK